MELLTPFQLRQRRNSAPQPASAATVTATTPGRLAQDADDVLVLAAPTLQLLPPFTGAAADDVHAWKDNFEKALFFPCLGLTPAKANAAHAKAFALNVARGSEAEEWWNKLGAGVQSGWELITACINRKWARRPAHLPTKADHWRDFQAHKITLEEAVRRVQVSGSSGTRPGYVGWADKLQTLGERSAIPYEIMVSHVLKDLVPFALARLLPVQPADWPSFCDAIRAIPAETLELEYEHEQRVQQNQAVTKELVDKLAATEARMNEIARRDTPRGRGFTPPPGYSPPPRRSPDGWFGSPTQSATPSPRATPRVYQAPLPQVPQAAPQTPGVAATPPPSTPRPRWGAPVPQTPGTLAPEIGCIRCGLGEHNARTCENKPLPAAEQDWREASRRQAFLRARQQTTPTAPRRFYPPTPSTPSPRRPYQQALIDEYYDDYLAENIYALDDFDEDDGADMLAFIHGYTYDADAGKVDGASR